MGAAKAKLSSKREALAEAINEHQRAVAEREALNASLSSARSMVVAIEERLADIRSKLGEARDKRTASILEAATSGVDTVPASPELRALRLEEAEAQDELEAASAAVFNIETSMAYPRGYDGLEVSPITETRKRLMLAVDVVQRDEVDLDELMERAKVAKRQLFEILELIVRFHKRKLFTSEDYLLLGPICAYRVMPHLEYGGTIDAPRIAGCVTTADPEYMQLVAAFDAAHVALQTDAAA